ncbi:MAG TPA: HAD-IC family P-type ATPase [Caldilineaceae bacterium]|nr:HAD-IC family P-type ATPase [Caldilineaceae bacterium]
MSIIQGLSTSEVHNRRQQGLGNTTSDSTGRTYRDIIRANLFSTFNNILFAVGTMLAVLGRYNDAFVTVIVGLVNAVISTVQEIRAKKQLDQIAVLARPKVTVIRDGQPQEVVAEELVQGDIVRLQAGDQAVVDGHVLGDGTAEMDESLLTGESDLIRKRAGDEILSGSFCVTGDLYFAAEKVGNESFANKLTAAARNYNLSQTPLQSRVGYAVRLLMAIAVLMGVIFYVAGFIQDFTFSENVRATAVLVGLVPYGLFLTIAVAYALGAVTIANRGALVQQSNAVESLSNVDVLCMDKTGTLTANRLLLNGVTTLDGQADGVVRAALGDFVHSASTTNSTSSAIAAGIEGTERTVADEVAFASSRKWSALAFDSADRRGVYVLGAVEMLADALPTGALAPSAPLAQAVSELSDEGLRVLLFAHNPTVTTLHGAENEPTLPPLTPLALITLRDELRPQAKETLRQFLDLGVQLKIISGDNPQTVAALARQAGFDDPQLISGPQLATMSKEEIRLAAEEATIFGRISPEQKQLLVDLLTEDGHYVAMMGDGVNDVLSLKKAKLGIAMQSGSNATRNVADMVLLGDSYAALVPALSEGKRIINGITDATYLLVGRGVAYAMIIVGVMMVGLNFPFEPAQLGLTTFSVGFPAFMLTLWARPEERNEPLLPSLVRFVLPFAVWTMVLGVILYSLSHTQVMGSLGNMDIPRRGIDFFERVTGLTYGVDADFETMAATLMAQTQLSTFVSLATMLLVLFLQPPFAFFAVWRPISPDRRPAYLTLVLMVAFLFALGIPPVASYFGIINVPFRASGLLLLGLIIWIVGFRLILKQRWFDKLLLMESW